MMSGAKFVEISTYLKNHTTLDDHQRIVVTEDLYAIQRLKEQVNLVVDEIFDFIN